MEVSVCFVVSEDDSIVGGVVIVELYNTLRRHRVIVAIMIAIRITSNIVPRRSPDVNLGIILYET